MAKQGGDMTVMADKTELGNPGEGDMDMIGPVGQLKGDTLKEDRIEEGRPREDRAEMDRVKWAFQAVRLRAEAFPAPHTW